MIRDGKIPFECVVAYDRGRVIGFEGRLPWPRLHADMRRFRDLTMGKPVVMGRRTYESLPHDLKGREMIVLGSSPAADGVVTMTSSLEAAQAAAQAAAQRCGALAIMIIGGACLYEAFLPLATRLYLTEIDADYSGDTWFPDIDRRLWREVTCIDIATEAVPLKFIELERRRMSPQATAKI